MRPDAVAELVHPRLVDGLPRGIAGELARTDLIERLAGRWEVAVTAVVAGAGFGKSTTLAQAARLHLANPHGVEAWVTCEPGDEDARRLSSAICRAFAAGAGATCPVQAALEALRAPSPLQTCLVLDDLHELPAGSSGHQLVAELVRRLPAGAHLVLAGRSLPPLSLSRLRAADRLAEIGEPDLGFTPAELAALAGRAGRDQAHVAGLGGWPALARLTLAAPVGVTRAYLWDEVVSRLVADERTALLALAMLGSTDGATLTALCGTHVDAAALADRVPLVDLVADDEARAHPLWTAALARLLPTGEVAAMRARVGDLLLRRDDPLRAGAIAVGAGDLELLGRAATALVMATLATFPYDTGARWLAAVPQEQRRRPGLLLLEAATRQALRADDAGVDRLVDAAGEAACRAGDGPTEAAALSLAAIAAHARGAQDRLFAVYQRAAALPNAGRHPALRVLTGAVHAAVAEMCGDVDAGLAALEPICDGPAAAQPGSPVSRFHVHLLLLAGRADEAAALAERRLSGSPYANVRRMVPFARWMAGRPADMLGLVGMDGAAAVAAPDADTNARFRFNFLTFGVVVAAALGQRDAVGRLWRQVEAAASGEETRDAADLTVAAMARAVADHDERAAAAVLGDFLTLHPLTDPVAAVRLRRFLAYSYVLSGEARLAWEAQPLGPAHVRVRAVARQLVAAREDRLRDTDRLGGSETILTAFPLPWSVELAVRADAAGLPGGAELMQWLTDRLGAVAREELKVLARSGGPLAAAADRMLLVVPATPAGTTRVEVVGPLRVLVDGKPVQRPELRRRRVRQLLALLAVHGQLHRGRVMDLLWPDLDPPAAARNLRVTLTYLRRVLEPERRSGEPGYHLRVDRDTVWLAESATLGIDLHDLRAHLAAVRAAAATGGLGAVDARLAAIVALWRGEPLSDLAGLPDPATQAGSLAAGLAGAAVMLGERRLTEGDPGQARHLAERALAVDPYGERGLRLLLAAELQRRDPAAIDRAVQRVRDALDALDAVCEPATAMVLRQAHLACRS
jgi:DNA-binding SARP family transcriptional activator